MAMDDLVKLMAILESFFFGKSKITNTIPKQIKHFINLGFRIISV